MIKKLIFLSGLLILGYGAQAQQLRTAIVIGATAAQIDGDDRAGYNKPGIVAGGATSFLFSDKLSLQPEVLFIQKGTRTTDKNDYFLKVRLNYVSIPLLANYQFHPKFNAQAGLSADYLLSANTDSGFGFENTNETYNSLDYNAVAGFEYKLSDEFGLNARFRYSITGISSIGLYNHLVTVSLRYYLN